VAKENATADKNNENAKAFIDRTDQKWFVKKGSNKITFCASIDELIEGKAENYDFVKAIQSSRFIKNKNDEEIEKNNYIIFVIKDDSMVLVRRYDEMK
jgi:hypothetical protein